MKIVITAHDGRWGSIELGKTGALTLVGDQAKLQSLVRRLKRPGMSNEAFLESLPSRLNSQHVQARRID